MRSDGAGGGLSGPDGARRARETPWGRVWVRPSIVHRYGTVKRSVEPRRVIRIKF